jgi:hypothetical protein
MNGPVDGMEGLREASALLEGLGKSLGPTSWIAGLEVRLRGSDGAQVGLVEGGTPAPPAASELAIKPMRVTSAPVLG